MRMGHPPVSKACRSIGNTVCPSGPQLLGKDPKVTAAASLIGQRRLDDEHRTLAFDEYSVHQGKGLGLLASPNAAPAPATKEAASFPRGGKPVQGERCSVEPSLRATALALGSSPGLGGRHPGP
jgi:hypothetical protein